jgi:hypothetical protein
MRFPIIKVRDKADGRIHILGTNSHDTLYVDNSKGLQYLNLQCDDGTGRDGSYEFVVKGNKCDPYAGIEFVDFDTLFDIYKKQVKLDCEQERQIRNIAKDVFDKYFKENRLDEDTDIQHS